MKIGCYGWHEHCYSARSSSHSTQWKMKNWWTHVGRLLCISLFTHYSLNSYILINTWLIKINFVGLLTRGFVIFFTFIYLYDSKILHFNIVWILKNLITHFQMFIHLKIAIKIISVIFIPSAASQYHGQFNRSFIENSRSFFMCSPQTRESIFLLELKYRNLLLIAWNFKNCNFKSLILYFLENS